MTDELCDCGGCLETVDVETVGTSKNYRRVVTLACDTCGALDMRVEDVRTCDASIRNVVIDGKVDA